MEAVKASLFIGISAFFRVLFAQRILEVFDLKLCFAFSFIVLFVYVLDRSFDFKSNQTLILAIAFLVIAIVLSDNLYAPFIALIIGFMYSKGIRGFRLKKG